MAKRPVVLDVVHCRPGQILWRLRCRKGGTGPIAGVNQAEPESLGSEVPPVAALRISGARSQPLGILDVHGEHKPTREGLLRLVHCGMALIDPIEQVLQRLG